MNQLRETDNRTPCHHSGNNTSFLYLFIPHLDTDLDPERWENIWCGNRIRTESYTAQSEISYVVIIHQTTFEHANNLNSLRARMRGFSFSYVRQKLPGVYNLSSQSSSWSCKTFCTGTVLERHARKAGLKEQPDGELAIPEWQNVAHSYKENALHSFLRHNLALSPIPVPTVSPCFALKHSELSFTFLLFLLPVAIHFIRKALLTKLLKQRSS